MEKEKDSKNIIWSRNNENDKIMKKFYEDFFEKDFPGRPIDVDEFREGYGPSMVDKYQCENKYVDILLCLDKTNVITQKRCEPLIENLGRCIFDRAQVERTKASNKNFDKNL